MCCMMGGVWIVVHFCILRQHKTNHPALCWSLFNIFYLEDAMSDQMKIFVNFWGFFVSNNTEKWDCDNKSLECPYWTKRTLLNTVQIFFTIKLLHNTNCTIKHLHNHCTMYKLYIQGILQVGLIIQDVLVCIRWEFEVFN